MPRTLFVEGEYISQWTGVQVWKANDGHFQNITRYWDWSATPHEHYEVSSLPAGSFWVPVSTHPPSSWGQATIVRGTTPMGNQPVNPNGTELRPVTTYIWIPNASIPDNITPGLTTNMVDCGPPTSFPPSAKNGAMTALEEISTRDPHALLDEIRATSDTDQKPFQDSDGLISFVNLSSSFVTSNKEFTTGREVCDKVSNFFATLRLNVFSYLVKNPGAILQGDTAPTTQWDPAVTHFMQHLLAQSGGLTNFKVTTESYSITQVITEFSTAFIKIFFDAATCPEEVVIDVQNFIQGVGKTLRTSWDNRSRNYQVALLGQCHEAVPVDSSGNTTVYFPKIKYYYLSVNSSQQEFSTSCASVQKVTFDFQYEYYVTGLKASVLDNQSDDYTSFVQFLDKAQKISYQDATNTLNSVLGVTSDSPNGAPSALNVVSDANEFGVDYLEYPRTALKAPKTIERILNDRAR